MNNNKLETIAPADIKAGDRILIGEKAANQFTADQDAQVRTVGAHSFITVSADNGATQLNLLPTNTVQVRRSI